MDNIEKKNRKITLHLLYILQSEGSLLVISFLLSFHIVG